MLDEESTQYLAFEPEQKIEAGAKALFDYVRSAYDSDEPIHSYAIAEKVSDRYVGSCGFAIYDKGIYECYYSINKPEWGKGIATEATKAMANQLAKTHEVRAYCHPQNHAAHAVAKKAGFIPQGLSFHQNFNIEGELFIYKKSAGKL
jgi:RimJ/RimL family protein N-acetyltransferase